MRSEADEAATGTLWQLPQRDNIIEAGSHRYYLLLLEGL